MTAAPINVLDKPSIKSLLDKVDVWPLEEILCFAHGKTYSEDELNIGPNDDLSRKYKWALKAVAKHRFKSNEKDVQPLRCVKYIETLEKTICTVDKTDFMPWVYPACVVNSQKLTSNKPQLKNSAFPLNFNEIWLIKST